MKIALYDSGVGNLHSLEKAFDRAVPGASITIESSAVVATRAELLVLPGVGGWGALDLRAAGPVLKGALEAGLPCVGVCLGMQMLFERSEEAPGDGIGFLPGDVTLLRSPRRPHMGWSALSPGEHVGDLALPEAVYYAHSFACRPAPSVRVLATTTVEGDTFPAIVEHGRTIGVQFHPEKSSSAGVELLGDLVRRVTA